MDGGNTMTKVIKIGNCDDCPHSGISVCKHEGVTHDMVFPSEGILPDCPLSDDATTEQIKEIAVEFEKWRISNAVFMEGLYVLPRSGEPYATDMQYHYTVEQLFDKFMEGRKK